jgi:hypothetical protein
MLKIKITMDDDLLYQVMNRLSHISDGRSMPALAAAMNKGADIIRDTWKWYAGGGNLPGVEPLKNPQGGYMRSIYIKHHGPFDKEIKSDSPAAGRLEQGTPELDMKKTHPYGPRSRMSTTGGAPYLIIPFRWGTPGNKGAKRVSFGSHLPQTIYNIVKQKRFSKSFVAEETHTHVELNARGEGVERNEYIWGARLSAGDAMRGSAEPEENSRMNGMVRMFGDDGKSAGYFTFRVISSKKPRNWDKKPHKTSWERSWIIPATNPRPIRNAVVNAARKDVAALFESSAAKDLGL